MNAHWRDGENPTSPRVTVIEHMPSRIGVVPPSPHAWGQTTYHLEGDSNLLLCGVT